MVSIEQVQLVMWIVIPIVLVVTIGGFIIFTRWGTREKERNRLKPPLGLD